MKNIRFALLFFMAATLIGCQKNDINNTKEAKQITLPSHAAKVLNSNNNFGISLFSNVADKEHGNIMLSPLSANIALSMLLNGADGETYNQIRNMLGYEGLTLTEINTLYETLTGQLLSADKQVALNLANAMFYGNTFPVKDLYKSDIETAYQAEIEGLDFGDTTKALSKINGWASKNTNGKIEKVLGQISPNAVMFLLNAVYFKGDWSQKFDKDNTKNLKFTLNDGSKINVPTMSGEIPIKRYDGANFTACELSYGRNNFVMDLIMPTQALPEFIAEFNSDLYTDITIGLDLQTSKTSHTIQLPKFKFKYEIKLNETLETLGMVDAFSGSHATYPV